jgi:hypothetical protein
MTRSLFSRLPLCAIVAVFITLTGCKKSDESASDAFSTSLLFDNASPDAREALATPVNFRLTDANFAQWELAQQYLDDLPRSALPGPSGGGRGNAIDRAVARLESSPRARTAIERTGLSVRDFVLATIALAQATAAGATGKLVSTSPIAAENFRFAQRHGSSILRAREQARVARARSEEDYLPADTAAQVEGAMVTDVDARHEAEMQLDSAATSQRAQPDSLSGNSERPPNSAPARDSVRDSVPPL